MALLDTDVQFPNAPNPTQALGQGMLSGLSAGRMIQEEKRLRETHELQKKAAAAAQARQKMEDGLTLVKEGWVPKDYKLALFKQNIQPYFSQAGLQMPDLQEWPDFGDKVAKEVHDIIEKSKKMNNGKGVAPAELQTMIGMKLAEYEPEFQKRVEPVLGGLKAQEDARQAELTRQADLQKAAMSRIPAGYRMKADGTLEPIPGGPAKANESEKLMTARQRVSGNLKQMRVLYDQLSKLGGIVDTTKDPLSNTVARVRSSGTGQATGTTFGTKAQSIRNQIKSIQPLLIQEIRQATQMGARGLDSEKELVFYLQAATDPKRDLQSNLAALKVLENAYGLGSSEAQSKYTKTATSESGEKVGLNRETNQWEPIQ